MAPSRGPAGHRPGPEAGRGRWALLGLGAGTVFQFLSLYAIEPLIARATGKLPDVSLFAGAAQVLGGSRAVWIVALLVTSALFGAGHLYQGMSGAIATGLTGLIMGALYLGCGRNLWVPIMAHGANDTVGFLLLFLGRYPGQ